MIKGFLFTVGILGMGAIAADQSVKSWNAGTFPGQATIEEALDSPNPKALGLRQNPEVPEALAPASSSSQSASSQSEPSSEGVSDGFFDFLDGLTGQSSPPVFPPPATPTPTPRTATPTPRTPTPTPTPYTPTPTPTPTPGPPNILIASAIIGPNGTCFEKSKPLTVRFDIRNTGGLTYGIVSVDPTHHHGSGAPITSAVWTPSPTSFSGTLGRNWAGQRLGSSSYQISGTASSTAKDRIGFLVQYRHNPTGRPNDDRLEEQTIFVNECGPTPTPAGFQCSLGDAVLAQPVSEGPSNERYLVTWSFREKSFPGSFTCSIYDSRSSTVSSNGVYTRQLRAGGILSSDLMIGWGNTDILPSATSQFEIDVACSCGMHFSLSCPARNSQPIDYTGSRWGTFHELFKSLLDNTFPPSIYDCSLVPGSVTNASGAGLVAGATDDRGIFSFLKRFFINW